jgi:hypothetical protein
MLSGNLLELLLTNQISPSVFCSQIHNLRSRPDRVAIGLSLFAEAQNEMAKSFGLSLLREYLSLPPSMSVSPQDVESRRLLRATVCDWLSSVLDHSNVTQTPQHIKNNMLSIFTLCVKRDYPELWPTAFQDLLSFGSRFGLGGIDVVIRVLTELEIEVVMFHENRTRDEVAHNTLIKDAMRASSVVRDIVIFLCQAADITARSEASDLAGRCLLSLAEMIGWIDIELVLNESLQTIYSFLQSSSPPCQVGALSCIYEVAKKGMDPVLKVELLKRVEMIPRLLAFRTDFTHASPLLDDHDLPLYSVHKQFGLVLDMVVLELLGCWSKFEDCILPPLVNTRNFVSASKLCEGKDSNMVSTSSSPLATGSTSPSIGGKEKDGKSATVGAELATISQVIVSMLREVVPELLNFLRHPFVTIARIVVPSCNKFVQLLKQQKQRADSIATFIDQKHKIQPSWTFFLAYPMLETLLFSVLHQCQFPEQFKFEDIDMEEEDENEVFEVNLFFKQCWLFRSNFLFVLLCVIICDWNIDCVERRSSTSDCADRAFHGIDFIYEQVPYYMTPDKRLLLSKIRVCYCSALVSN